MLSVAHTPRTTADLDDIWFSVALEDPNAADRLIDRLVARCRPLADPELGPARPEIARDARMLILDDYLILYRLCPEAVEIVRIVHGARKLHGLFDG